MQGQAMEFACQLSVRLAKPTHLIVCNHAREHELGDADSCDCLDLHRVLVERVEEELEHTLGLVQSRKPCQRLPSLHHNREPGLTS